jgi:hypothetical protein
MFPLSKFNCDPIQEEGGLNLYGFVANNSINYSDYLGNSFWHSAKCEAIQLYYLKKKAETALLLLTTLPDLYKNYTNMPFQHCVWNCRMAIWKGAGYAKLMSGLKEEIDRLDAEKGIALKAAGCWASLSQEEKDKIGHGARSAYQPSDFADNAVGVECGKKISPIPQIFLHPAGSPGVWLDRLFDMCECCCANSGVPADAKEGPKTSREFGPYAKFFPEYDELSENDATGEYDPLLDLDIKVP